MTEAIALYERLGYCRIPHFDLDVATRLGVPGAEPIMVLAFRRNLDDAPCGRGSRSDRVGVPPAQRSRRPR
jgi:hypothetical protein